MEVHINERIEHLFALTEAGKIDEFEFERQRMICEYIDAIDDPEQRKQAILLQQRIELERLNFQGDSYHFASYLFGRMWNSFLEMDHAHEPFRGSVDVMGQLDHASRKKLGQLHRRAKHLKVIHAK
jgi:hypothetical protein